MKVIIEYDDKSTQLLADIDKAIKIYKECRAEEIKRNTFHINVTDRYIQKCFDGDFKLHRLCRIRTNIIDHATPKVIIIESNDSTVRVEFNEE